MNNKHDQLKKAAKDAIEALFSDVSVDANVTRDDLGELRDDLDIKIASLLDAM